MIPSPGWTPGDDAWRRLAETVDDLAIILLDPAGRIVSWNRGADQALYKAKAEGRDRTVLSTAVLRRHSPISAVK
jgi:hypothetical protein